MNENRTGVVSGGTSILGLLGVAFVILKLVGVIDWSWIWVLCPFWIGTALVIAFIVFAFIILSISDLFEEWQMKRSEKFYEEEETRHEQS